MPPDTSKPDVSPRNLRLAGIIGGVVVVVAVTAGLAMRAYDSANLHEWTTEQATPTVVVIEPRKQDDSARLDLPGRLEAYSRAPLYARVSGYVKSWNVDIGTPVKAGQLLAEIEIPDLDQQLLQAKADLASAEATAALAEITAERWQLLLNSNYVSKQAAEEKVADFRNRQALVKAAQATVNRMRALEGFKRIVAPFDGIVTARTTNVGVLVNAAVGMEQELFVVSYTRKLRVYVSVPQTWVPSIPPGTQATIRVPERPGRSYTAAVESSAQAVDIASGATLMQLLVDNANAELLPGGFASISFDLPRATAVLALPASALIFDKAGLRVATVGLDNKVVLKPVTIMRDLGKVIEIGSGLASDERVIENPPDGIADGDLVRTVTNKAGMAQNANGGGKAY